jgi:hypothetical protein
VVGQPEMARRPIPAALRLGVRGRERCVRPFGNYTSLPIDVCLDRPPQARFLLVVHAYIGCAGVERDFEYISDY